jgi:hypothetical protein
MLLLCLQMLDLVYLLPLYISYRCCLSLCCAGTGDVACYYNATGALLDAICVCDAGSNENECASLGTSVGSQTSVAGGCVVVNCGNRGLTHLPSFPSTVTKLDLQNNPNVTAMDPSTFKSLKSLTWLYIQAVRTLSLYLCVLDLVAFRLCVPRTSRYRLASC